MFPAAVLFVATIPIVVTQTIDSTSSCTGDQYMSNNGLNFYTDCPPDTGSSHAKQTSFWEGNEDTAEDCMNACAVAPIPCYAITYSNGICFEYNDTLFPESADGFRAIADSSQLAMPDEDVLACPYDPDSIQTVDGIDFLILCEQDFRQEGGDYCAYEEQPAKCPGHTDTMEECMQLCSEAHPLCKGVTWNADLLNGFGNCYLKKDPEVASPSDRVATHSAKIMPYFYNELDTTCPPTPYEAGGSNYTIACKSGREGTQNTTSVHSNSLESCLGNCSSNIDAGCQGVLFDMDMKEGNRNCYLLNDTGSPSPGGANMTFAELVTSNTGSASGGVDKDGGSGGSSKAWIAGPVIGAVVLIAAVIGGVIWWRRRRAASSQGRNGWQVGTEGPGAAMSKGQYSDRQPIHGGEKSGEPTVRHEMQDPNSERLWSPEMNA